MKRLFKMVYVVVVVFGINQAAIATDLGSFSGGLTANFSLPIVVNDLNTWIGSVTENGSFTHTYNFSIPDILILVGVAAPINFSFNIGPFPISSNITNLSLNLFDSANNNVGFSPGAFVLADTLSAGDYHFDISGIANGTIGDVYGAAVVAAVPEPEEWAMMVVGLLLVGMQIARERKRNAVQSFSIAA